MVVGHFLGCGWSVEQINKHLQQFPDGIAGRYLAERRLSGEISRSAGKYNDRALPRFDGWKVPEKIVEARPQEIPEPISPEPETPAPDPDEDEIEDDLDELEKGSRQGPKLPPLYAHGARSAAAQGVAGQEPDPGSRAWPVGGSVGHVQNLRRV
jgi:hypothetical protein